MLRRSAQSLTVFGVLLGAPAALAAPILPDFAAATFDPTQAVDNSFFPIVPGDSGTILAEGVDEEGEDFSEKSVLTGQSGGRVILGVQTTTLNDQAYEDGLLVEETFDYYAQDVDGNVWYMGEDVTNFYYDDDDNLIGTDNASAWIAGENGALPGFIMAAAPVVGLNYYQEFSAFDSALDQAEIWAVDLSLTVDGVTYEDVLQILETTELDPEAREFKYYAPGIGLIRVEEGLSANYDDPELVFDRVAAPVPLPASLAMMIAGLGTMAGLGYRRTWQT